MKDKSVVGSYVTDIGARFCCRLSKVALIFCFLKSCDTLIPSRIFLDYLITNIKNLFGKNMLNLHRCLLHVLHVFHFL